MFKSVREEIVWGGRPLILETGKLARQALAAVSVQYGETLVLAALTAAPEPREGDFLPLTVNYVEKFYAAGKIPGGFFRREARPSERETLIARLIDRPIRPLFAKTWRHETQLLITVLSYDMENDPDIVAMIAASAACALSGLPCSGPLAAARAGLANGELVLNPPPASAAREALDLVAAATEDALLMVESEAAELPEEQMLEAVMFVQSQSQPVREAIGRLQQKALAEGIARAAIAAPAEQTEPVAAAANARPALESAYRLTGKAERQEALAAARRTAMAACSEDEQAAAEAQLKTIERSIVRSAILSSSQRIDGRKLDEIRPIEAEAGILPRAHGSALFTRGETQALASATLGTGDDEQMIDGLDGRRRERFMLHYNFPPFSVGETGRTGFTSRRETGHGKLAWRALHPTLPPHSEFPYTLRCVAEITESNGSSSMASVCGCSLALMDAGVPLSSPCAGIAMGLILEGENHAILSDILGDEDHLGDMDFKVAGTAKGVTALQMDIKVSGITRAIMDAALKQAQAGRQHILTKMAEALARPREEVGQYAPRIETMQIPVDKIGAVIGPGGKVIREIVETSGAKVEVEDGGIVKIAASDPAAIASAREQIESLAAEPETGKIYEGKVVRIMDFGAFVNYCGKHDGLVHISQIADERINNVADVLKIGDTVKVKLVEIDDRGRARLSMREAAQPSNGQPKPSSSAPPPSHQPKPEVGKIYEGKVVRIMDFGAFVNYCGKQDGLVHISQIADERISSVGDVLRVGDTVKVKLVEIDDRGRSRLSMRGLDSS